MTLLCGRQFIFVTIHYRVSAINVTRKGRIGRAEWCCPFCPYNPFPAHVYCRHPVHNHWCSMWFCPVKKQCNHTWGMLGSERILRPSGEKATEGALPGCQWPLVVSLRLISRHKVSEIPNAMERITVLALFSCGCEMPIPVSKHL